MIKSQDDLNVQGGKSGVLIEALKKCQELEKENQQLKELLNYIRDEIADMPSCSYQWGFGWVHEAAYKIDEVLK